MPTLWLRQSAPASAGEGKVVWALQRDYAEAAAAVLAGSGHENTVYELSGKPLTQEEIASALGIILEKEVTVLQLDDATYAETMSGAGVPDFVIPILIAIQKSIREGSLDVESDDFEKLLGRPATPANDALAQIVKGLATAD